MLFRTLDENGDWTFGNGINNFLTGSDAMAANLKTRLKVWKGECFFATENGPDWNNFLGIGTKDFLDSDIRQTILGSDGVIRIDNYTSQLSIDSRSLSVQATILTIFGTFTLSEVL